MASPKKPKIDFSTQSPTSNLQLQLDLGEVPKQPIDIVIDAGNVDVAHLGIAIAVNGQQLDTCSAGVRYRLSLPVRDLKVGSNQIELSRPPLTVQSIEVVTPPGSPDDDPFGLDFGITIPDQGNK